MDATERIARPVLANPEQLVAGTRPWHRGACLQLASLTPYGKRHERGQHECDLPVRTRPLTAEETERVAGPDRPTVGPDGSSPQLAKNLQPAPATGRHDACGEPDLCASHLAVDPGRAS